MMASCGQDLSSVSPRILDVGAVNQNLFDRTSGNRHDTVTIQNGENR